MIIMPKSALYSIYNLNVIQKQRFPRLGKKNYSFFLKIFLFTFTKELSIICKRMREREREREKEREKKRIRERDKEREGESYVERHRQI